MTRIKLYVILILGKGVSKPFSWVLVNYRIKLAHTLNPTPIKGLFKYIIKGEHYQKLKICAVEMD